MAAREDHAPALGDLSPVEDVGGWKEERDHHALASEIHSIVRACHAPVRGHPERSLPVSTEEEDDGKSDGEARVIQNLVEKRRSKFKK